MSDATPAVNTKNTKKEILEAYHTVLDTLNSDKGTMKSKADTEKSKVKATALKTAEKVAEKDMMSEISDLRSLISTQLFELSESIEEGKTTYISLKQAIEEKEKEIQDVFGIEKEAFSLAALITAHEESEERFKLELTKFTEEFATYQKNMRQEWQEEQSAYKKKLGERTADETKERARQKEEFEYSLERSKQQQMDEVNDHIDKRKTVLADALKEHNIVVAQSQEILTERGDAIAAQEDNLAGLQQEVDDFPAILEQKIKDAKAATSGKMAGLAKREKETTQILFDGEKSILAAKIATLEDTVNDQSVRITTLTTQLDNAYGKVQDIAIKAVSSGDNSAAKQVKADKP